MNKGWLDRRVKQRLVGATILVALVVLIVPEFLTGPKHAVAPPPQTGGAAEPERSVTVDLTTSKAMPEEEASAASAAGAVAAFPAPAAPDAAAALETNASPPISAVPDSVGSQSGVRAETAQHHWAVQVGSFANNANAKKLVHILKAHHGPVYISPSGAGAAARYRVRIGPMADREAALAVQQKLVHEGHPTSLVPP